MGSGCSCANKGGQNVNVPKKKMMNQQNQLMYLLNKEKTTQKQLGFRQMIQQKLVKMVYFSYHLVLLIMKSEED